MSPSSGGEAGKAMRKRFETGTTQRLLVAVFAVTLSVSLVSAPVFAETLAASAEASPTTTTGSEIGSTQSVPGVPLVPESPALSSPTYEVAPGAPASAQVGLPVPLVTPVAPVQYLSMEEIGLLRERTDPDVPFSAPSDESRDTSALQSFRVVGRPWMPTGSRLTFTLPKMRAPLANVLLGVWLMGLVLVPLLGLLTRFVKGEPLFGCELPFLASKSCRSAGPYGPRALT